MPLAYLAACRLPEVACAVGYYGVGIEKALAELEGLQGRRLVLHAAELDQLCPPEARADIFAAGRRTRTSALSSRRK